MTIVWVALIAGTLMLISAVQGGPGPPERNPAGSWVFWNGDLSFEYVDATMTGAVKLEDDPIGEVFQWLKDDNYKCIDVRTVLWRGSTGNTTGRQFGKKRYLIECRGDCRGIRYEAIRDGAYQKFHCGTSKAFPVIHQETDLFVYRDFQWRFSRAASDGPPPTIRIYTWGVGADYGPTDNLICSDSTGRGIR
jgi:hypothetical protein